MKLDEDKLKSLISIFFEKENISLVKKRKVKSRVKKLTEDITPRKLTEKISTGRESNTLFCTIDKMTWFFNSS